MLPLAARARYLDEVYQCLALGFNLLEITLPCGTPAEEQAYNQVRADRGVHYLAHGPQEGDPSQLVHLEKGYLPQLRQALEACRRLDCPGLTIHFWLEPRWLKPEIIKGKIELLARVVEWGETLGIGVYLENLSENDSALAAALEAVPALGLTLDVGHAQLLQKENVAPAILDRFHHRLRHVHLHDNLGGYSPRDDRHLPPGQGQVPFMAIFERLKKYGYQGPATLELKPEELTAARDWVTRLWSP